MAPINQLSISQIRSLLLSPGVYPAVGLPFGLRPVFRNAMGLAVAQGLITVNEGADGIAERSYHEPFMDSVWQLIIEGIWRPGKDFNDIAPGGDHSPISYRLTEYGRRCVEAKTITPHDSDGYLANVRQRCPCINPTAWNYVEEAIGTYRRGYYVATAVMIGVAAEAIVLQLSESIAHALESGNKQESLRELTTKRGGRAKVVHDEIRKRLIPLSGRLPLEIGDNLGLHLDGIFDFIRQTRNDAGHPTGRRIEKNVAESLLLLFPVYAKTANTAIDWLLKNKI